MRLRNAAIPALLLTAFIFPAVVFASQEKPATPELLDLNSATVEQLKELPGIGPSIAKSIVRFREKSGPFKRVEDLLAIRGITKKRLEAIRPLVTVNPVKAGLAIPIDAG